MAEIQKLNYREESYVSKKKQFAVLGLGRFGSSVAIALESMGYDVLGVDKDEAIAASMSDKLTHVMSFDIRNATALKQAGISNVDTVVIASKVLEASLMAAMLCAEMKVPEIVVKAIDERHAEMVRKLGATNVIFSERDTARRVAMHLVSDHTIDYMDINAYIKILGLDVPPQYIGKTLMETDWRAEYNVNVIALNRKDETIISPSPALPFEKGDRIFIVGSAEALAKFEADSLES